MSFAFGGSGSAMRLFLPEALLGGLPATGAVNRNGPVEISVTAAEGDVVLGPDELADLSAGDILTTDAPAGGEVIVRVAGIPKYRARLGACNGRRAVTILGPIEPAAHEPASIPAAAVDDENMGT